MEQEAYAIDLDEEIISHLADPEAWAIFRGEGFKVELIEDDFVKEVYEWADKHLREHGKPPSASVLAEQFDIEFVPPLTAAGDLVNRLRERYMKNSGRKVLKSVGELYQEDPLATPEFMTKEGHRLQRLLSKRGEIFGTGDHDRALQGYEQKVGQGPGASLGHEQLDTYFYGQRGLTFVVAPPKTYKSWQMIKMVLENVKDGRYVWLHSLELPAEESYMRFLCMAANVPWWHYLQNCLTRHEQQLMGDAAQMVAELGTFEIAKHDQGERSIERLVGRARDAGADIIFVDQLQYVEGSNRKSLGETNETGQYWGVCDRARDLSDEGPICFAHQFNRETRFADSMPDIRLAKGSSAIEETATLALGLWANKDMRRSNIVEIGTLISRNYDLPSWEMSVEMNKGCNFEIIGRVEDDEA